MQGRWTHILTSPRLQRSSQCLAALSGRAYVFGGEVKPREPIDSQTDVIKLGEHENTLETLASPNDVPSSRIGSASATIDGSIYYFSGRGGLAMAPIEERGALWQYKPGSPSPWSLISPTDASNPYPQARSYHAMASDGASKLYVHAGCPESGRLADLWSFDIRTKAWKELASAPGPPRGGTSIAYSGGKLYRMNGFDGKSEVGGAIDVYTPDENSWTNAQFVADNKEGPGPRSVSALVPVHHAGRSLLVVLFGEQDPSALGHAGAGKMLKDVWAWDIESQAWSEVEGQGDARPDARGWFDADVVEQDGKSRVIVHGGLAESNDRLGDVWELQLV